MNSIVRLFGLALLTVAPAYAADVYKLDPVHTQVTFFVNHMGFSNSSGRFHLSDSALQLDEKDWSKSSVQVTIPLSTLDMGDATWKEHLSGARFFEVDKYPTMTFKSTKVESVGPNQLKVIGDLTLHGVTKSVVLDTKINKVGAHPMSRRPAAGFSATAKLKRSDFGMTQNIPMIGDEVEIRIETEGSVPAASGG
jgi:polyisoprenoid-binding protein YceI